MLGVIFFGIATPVEAAGIGTFGALVVCALNRRLNWVNVSEAAIATLKATSMVMWIFFGATMFVGFFIVKGGQTFVASSIIGTGLPPYGILLLMMAVLFVLGMFLDWVGHPAAHRADLPAHHAELAFDRRPRPAGREARGHPALVRRHLHRSTCRWRSCRRPSAIRSSISRAWRRRRSAWRRSSASAVPFIGLQAIGNALCIVFPQIILYLPAKFYSGH